MRQEDNKDHTKPLVVFCSYVIVIISICCLIILYINIISCQLDDLSNNINILPNAYSQNETIEKNQNTIPLGNSSFEKAVDNINRSSPLLVESIINNDNSSDGLSFNNENNNTGNITGKLENTSNTVNKSFTSIINTSTSNMHLIHKLNENLDYKLGQIKKSIDDSSLFATLGLTLGLVSIALSLIIPFLYDLLKRPHLVIEAGTISRLPGYSNVFVHGKVINRPQVSKLDRKKSCTQN